jgi:hypothetical protein
MTQKQEPDKGEPTETKAAVPEPNTNGEADVRSTEAPPSLFGLGKIGDTALFISIATLYAYCWAYAYDAGFFDWFRIPADYIRIGTSNLVEVAVQGFALAVIFGVAAGVRIILKSKGKKLRESRDSRKPIEDLVVALTFVCILLAVFMIEGYWGGNRDARAKSVWQVLTEGHYQNYVILTAVDDFYLLGEVDYCTKHIVGMAIIKADSDTLIHWKNQVVGPLKPQPPTTPQPYPTATPKPRTSACPNPSASAAAPIPTKAP